MTICSSTYEQTINGKLEPPPHRLRSCSTLVLLFLLPFISNPNGRYIKYCMIGVTMQQSRSSCYITVVRCPCNVICRICFLMILREVFEIHFCACKRRDRTWSKVDVQPHYIYLPWDRKKCCEGGHTHGLLIWRYPPQAKNFQSISLNLIQVIMFRTKGLV